MFHELFFNQALNKNVTMTTMNYYKKCNFGVSRVSILPPTHINTVSSDGFIRASKAPNTSPLVVFVNSKSGDNQVIY